MWAAEGGKMKVPFAYLCGVMANNVARTLAPVEI